MTLIVHFSASFGAAFLAAAAGLLAPPVPQARVFDLSYAASVKGVRPGEAVRLWLPIPKDSGEQAVRMLERRNPVSVRTSIGKEAKYGNSMLYAEGPADETGGFGISIVWRVRRLEVVRDLEAKGGAERFLNADARVPVGGKALTLIEGKRLPEGDEDKAREVYEIVLSHMKYSKEGKGWGQGDSDWACGSKYGNCTDFHSLFISLARALKLPAKFEIGFSLPEERGEGEISGYHCWAYFRPQGKGWVPVDISEASKNPKLKEYFFGHLTADRVTLSVGRDLVLEPPQQGPPLNFFIFPYAEASGKPLPPEQLTRKVTYKDVK